MMKLRVAIDGRSLVGNRTGIGVHTAEIASRLEVEPPPLIASHAPIEDRSGIERCRFAVDPMRFGVAWQQMMFARVAERESCDVVWGPHGTLPLALRIPAVVSVHDLTSITMPHRHRVRTILSFNTFIGASLEKAAKIAAVSRVAADEVVRGFGVRASKVEIVPNGVDAYFSPDGGEREPFILYVGTLEPRKGIGELLDAWESLAKRPRLVLCGDAGWGTSPLMRGRRRLIEDGSIEVAGFVGKARLRELYRRCWVFAYPSYFEGFGLPPLEAMACGAPVVAARGGAVPEVVGDAALLVAPGKADDLRNALARVLADPQLARDLSVRGIDRAALFSWDESARRMLALMRVAAG